MELNGAHAADRIEKLGDTIALALAGMFELVGKIVLMPGVGLQSGNAAVKILDGRPALCLLDGSISDRGFRGFQYSRAAFLQHRGEIVDVFDALPLALISNHAIPGQGPNVVGLD